MGKWEQVQEKMERAERYNNKVPVGTLIKETKTKKIIFDLDEEGKQVIELKVAKGEKEINFATPTNRTPR